MMWHRLFDKPGILKRNLGPEQAVFVGIRSQVVDVFVLNMFEYDEFTALHFINRLR